MDPATDVYELLEGKIMLFGQTYKRDMSFEVFLRYLEPGIHKIQSIRESLCFIPDKHFARILKSACERDLISINAANKTLFVSKKIVEIIQFIEKYNFINELQLKAYNANHEFNKNLAALLRQTRDYENDYIDLNNALAKAMKIETGDDYISDILKFRF